MYYTVNCPELYIRVHLVLIVFALYLGHKSMNFKKFVGLANQNINYDVLLNNIMSILLPEGQVNANRLEWVKGVA